MRAQIRQEVDHIEPFDDREAQTKADVLRWIDSGEELCRRAKPAVPPRHLVAYFAVVDRDHVLLVDHLNAGLWLPPGGHVEPGEHPRDTVRREAREELSLGARFRSPKPLFLTKTRTVGATAGHTDVSLWYVLESRKERAVDYDAGEFAGVAWFDRREVPLDRSDPELGRFLAKLYSHV